MYDEERDVRLSGRLCVSVSIQDGHDIIFAKYDTQSDEGLADVHVRVGGQGCKEDTDDASIRATAGCLTVRSCNVAISQKMG